jgi:ribosomal protein S13
MAYLLETEISNTKSLIFSLSAIYGLGHEQSRIICSKLGNAENVSFSNLTKSQIISLQCFLKNSGLTLCLIGAF